MKLHGKIVPTVFFAIFVTLFFSQSTRAQQALLDSLTNELNILTIRDSARVDLLNRLSSMVYRNDPEQARIYARESAEISRERDYIKGEALANGHLGNSYYAQSEYDSTVFFHTRSYELFSSINDQRGMAIAQAAMGTINAVNNRFTEAIDHFLKALRSFEELEHYSAVAVMYNNVGNLYLEQKEYNEALINYQKSLDAFEQTPNKRQLITTLVNVGQTLHLLDRSDEALTYIQRGFENEKENNNSLSLISLYKLRASIYSSKGKYQLAKEDLTKTLALIKKLGAAKGLEEVNYRLGDIAYKQGQYAQAKSYLLQSLEYFERLEANMSFDRVDLLELLGMTDQKLGNYASGFSYAMRAKNLSDSLHRQETTTTIAELQTKYETEKREQTITLLETENRLAESEKEQLSIKAEIATSRIILTIVIGAFLLFLMAFIYNRKLYHRKVALELANKDAELARQKEREKTIRLESVQGELKNFGGFISEKDAFLSEIIETLSAIKQEASQFSVKKELSILSNKIQRTRNMTDEEEKLLQRIEQVNQGFFQTLETQFPHLTKADKRLSSLIKMDLSNKEIAVVLNINYKSVSQAKFRLKKKMKLMEDDDLGHFLNSIGIEYAVNS